MAVFTSQVDRLILAASSIPDDLMEEDLDVTVYLRRTHYTDEQEEHGFYFLFVYPNSTEEIFVSDKDILETSSSQLALFEGDNYDADKDLGLYGPKMAEIDKEAAEDGLLYRVTRYLVKSKLFTKKAEED